MNYADIKEKAKAYDGMLLAADPRFSNDVWVNHEDGSFFLWKKAFIMQKDNWILVFTEHFGYHIFDKSDLSSFKYKDSKKQDLEIEIFP